MLEWYDYSTMSNCVDAMIREMRHILTPLHQADEPTHVVLAGGTTPHMLYSAWEAMGMSELCSHVTLSDERCIPTHHPRSNTGTLRRMAPSLAPILTHYPTEDTEPEKDMMDQLHALPKPTITVAGMGNDGHIASLFSLQDCEATKYCVSTTATDDEARLSLSLPYLTSSRHMWLLISGKKKRDLVMQQARLSSLPIGVLLHRYAGSVQVYWTE